MKTESESAINRELVSKLQIAALADNPFTSDSALSTTRALYKMWEHRKKFAKDIMSGGFQDNYLAIELFKRHNDNIKEILGL